MLERLNTDIKEGRINKNKLKAGVAEDIDLYAEFAQYLEHYPDPLVKKFKRSIRQIWIGLTKNWTSASIDRHELDYASYGVKLSTVAEAAKPSRRRGGGRGANRGRGRSGRGGRGAATSSST